MRVYFSHAIRGQVGPNASIDTQNNNCDAAQEMAQQVIVLNDAEGDRMLLDFYTPADHEDFVQICYTDKYLKEAEILEIDCKIIDKCDACVVYVPSWDVLQGGRKIEWKYCIENDVPVIIFSRPTEALAFLRDLHQKGLN